MDTLSDVLNSVRFQGAMYGLIECTAPWGFRMPRAEGHIRLIMVVRGECIIQFVGEGDAIAVKAGELLLAKKDAVCEFMDSRGSIVLPIEELCSNMPTRGQRLKVGGGSSPVCGNGANGEHHDGVNSGEADGDFGSADGGTGDSFKKANAEEAGIASKSTRGGAESESATSLMLGCFTLDANQRNPFIASLPDVIHLNSDHVGSETGLESTIRLLTSEVAGNGPGGDILVGRLSEAILVQIIRAYITQIKNCKETPGWLKAIADPQIGSALSLIHEKPEAPWTVASLADAVNMSRTSFATRFASLVNETPIDYLTSWRMQKAVTLLRDGDANVEYIGSAVGYTSRAAFAKAFKKEFGRSPGEFRDG